MGTAGQGGMNGLNSISQDHQNPIWWLLQFNRGQGAIAILNSCSSCKNGMLLLDIEPCRILKLMRVWCCHDKQCVP